MWTQRTSRFTPFDLGHPFSTECMTSQGCRPLSNGINVCSGNNVCTPGTSSLASPDLIRPLTRLSQSVTQASTTSFLRLERLASSSLTTQTTAARYVPLSLSFSPGLMFSAFQEGNVCPESYTASGTPWCRRGACTLGTFSPSPRAPERADDFPTCSVPAGRVPYHDFGRAIVLPIETGQLECAVHCTWSFLGRTQFSPWAEGLFWQYIYIRIQA